MRFQGSKTRTCGESKGLALHGVTSLLGASRAVRRDSTEMRKLEKEKFRQMEKRERDT